MNAKDLIGLMSPTTLASLLVDLEPSGALEVDKQDAIMHAIDALNCLVGEQAAEQMVNDARKGTQP